MVIYRDTTYKFKSKKSLVTPMSDPNLLLHVYSKNNARVIAKRIERPSGSEILVLGAANENVR